MGRMGNCHACRYVPVFFFEALKYFENDNDKEWCSGNGGICFFYYYYCY